MTIDGKTDDDLQKVRPLVPRISASAQRAVVESSLVGTDAITSGREGGQRHELGRDGTGARGLDAELRAALAEAADRAVWSETTRFLRQYLGR